MTPPPYPTTARMEFPPETWFVFPAENFCTAGPRIHGDYTAELMAQARPNGRVLDHWRLALGGSKPLETEFNLAAIIPAAATLPKWRLTFQQWPRDVVIRRNMTTSCWVDLLTLLSANEVGAMSETGENVANPVVVEALKSLPDKTTNSASCRWAVCVGEASRLELQLQALPAPTSILTGKPLYKRYKN